MFTCRLHVLSLVSQNSQRKVLEIDVEAMHVSLQIDALVVKQCTVLKYTEDKQKIVTTFNTSLNMRVTNSREHSDSTNLHTLGRHIEFCQ